MSPRQVVESVSVACSRKLPDGRIEEGFYAIDVGPFDRLVETVRTALTEAAMDTLDDGQGFLDVSLPFDPFNR